MGVLPFLSQVFQSSEGLYRFALAANGCLGAQDFADNSNS